jgi:hypothetical protein
VRAEGDDELPDSYSAEVDPADVVDQHRDAGLVDEEDYRLG